MADLKLSTILRGYDPDGACGVLHGSDRIGPQDDNGCVLPMDHDGPHEFVGPDGVRWLWETDLACECEWCRRCLGDYCTTYWRKTNAGELEYDSWLPVPAGVAAVDGSRPE